MRTGHIPEARGDLCDHLLPITDSFAETIATSIRFLALKELASVHGIGPLTARRLYDLGLRSVTDLRNYYGVDPDDESEDMESHTTEETPNSKENEVGIKAALRVYDDITTLYVLLSTHNPYPSD